MVKSVHTLAFRVAEPIGFNIRQLLPNYPFSGFKLTVISLLIIMVSMAVTNLQAETEPARNNTDELRTTKLEVTGNQHFSSSKVKSFMETGPKGFISRLLFWTKAPVFHQGLLESDLNRIERAYQREGFLSVRVDNDIKIKDRKVHLKILIEEGERVTVERVEYRLPSFTDNEKDEHDALLEYIKHNSKLSESSFFRDDDLRTDIRLIKDYYDEQGYPYIDAEHRLDLSPDESSVIITLNIEPGKRAFIGEISFDGLNRTDSKLLERLLTIETGDKYDPQKIDNTRRNLQSTGIFRLVSISLRLDSGTEHVPIEIYIREKDNISLTFGTGYGVEDRIRVYTEVIKMRFLGGLRTGTLFLKHSSLEPVNIDLKILQPVFPTVNSSVTLNPFYRQQEEPAYSIERLGLNTSLNHKLSNYTGAFFTYTFEDNRLSFGTDDIADTLLIPGIQDGNDSYRKSSISIGAVRNSSSPDFSPQRGSLVSNVLTFSGLGFDSDYQFLRMITDIRYYQSLGWSTVLAGRIKGGFIEPISDTRFIPYEDRFYAGGSFSVRGWRRADLGPKNIDGQPTGGKSYLEASIELRYPIWRQLSLVKFFDAGNVWKDTFAHDLHDLHYAAGAGFRYSTPFGPVRLDVAMPVFDDKKNVQFWISLGQMF